MKKVQINKQRACLLPARVSADTLRCGSIHWIPTSTGAGGAESSPWAHSTGEQTLPAGPVQHTLVKSVLCFLEICWPSVTHKGKLESSMQEEAECGWRPCKAGMLSPELCSVAWNPREILELACLYWPQESPRRGVPSVDAIPGHPEMKATT